MYGSLISIVSLLGLVAAQAPTTNFEGGTGTRSLWIPYKTISGIPLASLLARDDISNRTTYVIACPTGQADCAIAPNITLTEATDFARWESSTSGAETVGTVAIKCESLQQYPVTCQQNAIGGGLVRSTSQVLESSDISYQAVSVTATITDTATLPDTVTVTALPSTSTTSTTSSTGGATTLPSLPWEVLGAVGAGIGALLAL